MDDDFLAAFMARAQKRQAKLAQIDDVNMSSEAPSEVGEEGVSYPTLSPLPEEEETNRDEETNTGLGSSELDYSSDLSISLMETEPPSAVFRAEPVYCDQQQQEKQRQREQQQQQHNQRDPQHPRDQPLREIPAKDQNFCEPPPPSVHHQPVERALFAERPQPSVCEAPNEYVLRRKSERAEQTKMQLKKVVELAKYGSREHIEAARMLQIADLEHKEFLKRAEMIKKSIPDKFRGRGSVKMSNIKLRISPELRNDLAQDSVSHHFFCVAIMGTEIKQTKIIDTNDIRRQGLKDYLRFREEISFVDVSAKFEIRFEVFELIIGQQSARFLSKLTPSKKSRPTLESNFKRIGSMRLTLDDNNLSGKNLEQHGEYEKSRYIERACKFDLEVIPEPVPTKSGMLSVRRLTENGVPAWRRAWVDLSDGQIRFWNSKQDQLDDKKPNFVVQFKDICSERARIMHPDDNLYRRHSFALYNFQQITGGEGDTIFQKVLKDEPNYKLVFHQFSAANKEDRDSWCHIIDKSLHCFREWRGPGQIVSFDEITRLFAEMK